MGPREINSSSASTDKVHRTSTRVLRSHTGASMPAGVFSSTALRTWLRTTYVDPVPEPTSVTLSALGLVSFIASRRRRSLRHTVLRPVPVSEGQEFGFGRGRGI